MDPFVGEIRIFAGNYAPQGWALCNGALLPINRFTTLYSLLGTYYGGDGRSTFGLPDLQGRAPMHWGQGTGLTQRSLGEKGGTTTVTLQTMGLPQHTHPFHAAPRTADTSSPTPAGGTSLGTTSNDFYTTAAGNVVSMSQSSIGSAGGNSPHNNLQPYLTMTFIIALVGVYPQRP